MATGASPRGDSSAPLSFQFTCDAAPRLSDSCASTGTTDKVWCPSMYPIQTATPALQYQQPPSLPPPPQSPVLANGSPGQKSLSAAARGDGPNTPAASSPHHDNGQINSPCNFTSVEISERDVSGDKSERASVSPDPDPGPGYGGSTTTHDYLNLSGLGHVDTERGQGLNSTRHDLEGGVRQEVQSRTLNRTTNPVLFTTDHENVVNKGSQDTVNAVAREVVCCHNETHTTKTTTELASVPNQHQQESEDKVPSTSIAGAREGGRAATLHRQSGDHDNNTDSVALWPGRPQPPGHQTTTDQQPGPGPSTGDSVRDQQQPERTRSPAGQSTADTESQLTLSEALNTGPQPQQIDREPRAASSNQPPLAVSHSPQSDRQLTAQREHPQAASSQPHTTQQVVDGAKQDGQQQSQHGWHGGGRNDVKYDREHSATLLNRTTSRESIKSGDKSCVHPESLFAIQPSDDRTTSHQTRTNGSQHHLVACRYARPARRSNSSSVVSLTLPSGGLSLTLPSGGLSSTLSSGGLQSTLSSGGLTSLSSSAGDVTVGQTWRSSHQSLHTVRHVSTPHKDTCQLSDNADHRAADTAGIIDQSAGDTVTTRGQPGHRRKLGFPCSRRHHTLPLLSLLPMEKQQVDNEAQGKAASTSGGAGGVAASRPQSVLSPRVIRKVSCVGIPSMHVVKLQPLETCSTRGARIPAGPGVSPDSTGAAGESNGHSGPATIDTRGTAAHTPRKVCKVRAHTLPSTGFTKRSSRKAADGDPASTTATSAVTMAASTTEAGQITPQQPFAGSMPTGAVALKPFNSFCVGVHELRKLDFAGSCLVKQDVTMATRHIVQDSGIQSPTSRDSTPTLVRSRPRLPSGLVKSYAVQTPDGEEGVQSLLTSLSSTDFVRKYSRKGRGCTGSATCSPAMTPKSSITSPPYESGLGRSLTLTRIQSVKHKLERVKEDRINQENIPNQCQLLSTNSDNLQTDPLRSTGGLSSPSRQPCFTSGTMTTNTVTPVTSTSTVSSHGDISHTINSSHSHLEYAEIPEGRSRRSPALVEPAAVDVQRGDGRKCGQSITEVCQQGSTVDRREQEHTATPTESATDVQTTSDVIYTTTISEAKSTCTDDNDYSPRVPRMKPSASFDSDASPVPQSHRLRALASFEKESDDNTSLHVTEDEDSSSLSSRRRGIKDSSFETEDEGVGFGGDSYHPSYKDTYTSVTGSRKSPANSDAKVSFSHTIPEVASSTPGHKDITQTRLNEDSSKRLQRIPDGDTSPTNGNGKLANGRFLTHPPMRDRNCREGRSMDSNGLGSLRDSMERFPESEMASQMSVASLDSHICPSEGTEAPTYPDVMRDITAEASGIANLERRNSKTLKQKSKSDPSGEKQKETINLPIVISGHSQSTPRLSEESDNISSLPEFDKTERKISKSDNVLSSGESPEIGIPPKLAKHLRDIEVKVTTSEESSEETSQLSHPIKQVRRPSKKRQRGSSADSRWERKAEKLAKKSSSDGTKASKTKAEESGKRPATEPSSPISQSPEVNLQKRGSVSEEVSSLTVPHTKKSISITRSHSSGSVFLSKAEPLRNIGARPKEINDNKNNKSSRSSLQEHFGGMKSGSGVASETTPSPKLRERDRTAPYAFSPSLEPIFAQSTLSLFDGADEGKDKRDLIVQEFFSSEKQYVETLLMLVERYMVPLKTQNIVDSNLVDDIFYKINEIHMHHVTFLTFLEKGLRDWDNSSTIGDIIQQTFSKQSVIESYSSFIEHFPRAEKSLDEIYQKSSFQKFLDHCERETRTKLPLKAQIVKPAQRIPRYELLLKRLLDHTPTDHPDYAKLQEAEGAVHALALKINSAKEQKQEHGARQNTLKTLELLLITELVVPDRFYLRHDTVQVLNRKDQCCIWLFSDLVIFSGMKRKSGPVNRVKHTILLQSSSGNDYVENTKHKLWLKIPLDDLEVVKLSSSMEKKQLVDREELESDSDLLRQINDLSSKLNCSHQNLDDVVRELVSQVNKQLSEHQLKSPPPEANRLELLATTTEGIVNITVVFPSPQRRSEWELAVADAKNKLAQCIDGKPPDFLQPLQITKTRAGMQFSCAAPMEGVNTKQCKDVWVCNSDGYVGHMCLLSLQPEPIVTLNTPVPGCNSRILCICAVPPYQGFKRKGSGRRGVVTPIPPVTAEEEDGSSTPRIKVDKDRDVDVDGYTSDSSSSITDLEDVDMEEADISLQLGPVSSRSPSPEPVVSPTVQSSPRESLLLDPYKSTMWLGTEDGCIHIFLGSENIKTTKNRVKRQQNAGVLSIIHLDGRVFISLANGDIVVYKRDQDGLWDIESPETVTLASASTPLNKMLAVAGRLWCACGSNVYVINPLTVDVETIFTVGIDSTGAGSRGVQCLASSGLGVWVAAHGSSRVLLYHATTHQLLMEVNIAQAVAQKLQTADDIIRQHKTACLRITSLLACKDLLWVGTSAGVILTLPMPRINSTTTRSTLAVPTVTGLVYGHTGHVRFLTSVEMPGTNKSISGTSKNLESSGLPSWLARRASVNVHTLTMATKMLVISGGDGYEDFRSNANNEGAGRDDSTNHLLLWQV